MKKLINILLVIVVLFINTIVLTANIDKHNQESILIKDNDGSGELYNTFTIIYCEGYMPLTIKLGECKNVCGTFSVFGISGMYNSFTTYNGKNCTGGIIDVQYFQCDSNPPEYDVNGKFTAICSNT